MRLPYKLVINSNLGPIMPRFRDIAHWFSAEKSDPTLFHRNSGVFPLDWIADVVAPRIEGRKLIIRVITVELVQPICPRYLNVIDRRTDGRLTIAIPR